LCNVNVNEKQFLTSRPAMGHTVHSGKISRSFHGTGMDYDAQAIDRECHGWARMASAHHLFIGVIRSPKRAGFFFRADPCESVAPNAPLFSFPANPG
jgi:hypothetical protein